jgi:hypothetical protein
MPGATIIPVGILARSAGDVLLIYSERECSIYFPCWNENCKPADFIGQLSFEHAAGVRSFPHEYLPYKLPSHNHRSFVLHIPESKFVQEHIEYRKRHYPQYPIAEFNHYVVTGHDIYHEVLAVRFIAKMIQIQEIQDPRLLRLQE